MASEMAIKRKTPLIYYKWDLWICWCFHTLPWLSTGWVTTNYHDLYHGLIIWWFSFPIFPTHHITTFAESGPSWTHFKEHSTTTSAADHSSVPASCLFNFLSWVEGVQVPRWLRFDFHRTQTLTVAGRSNLSWFHKKVHEFLRRLNHWPRGHYNSQIHWAWNDLKMWEWTNFTVPATVAHETTHQTQSLLRHRTICCSSRSTNMPSDKLTELWKSPFLLIQEGHLKTSVASDLFRSLSACELREFLFRPIGLAGSDLFQTHSWRVPLWT